MKISIFHNNIKFGAMEGSSDEILDAIEYIQSEILKNNGLLVKKEQGNIFLSREEGPILLILDK